MNQSNRRNLTINGSGSSGGGLFNKVRIRGEGSITDDFECNTFKIHGTSEILGNVKAELLEIFGTTEARKNLIGNEVKIFGTIDVGGNAEIKTTKIRGTMDVGGKFTGDITDIKGSLNVHGDCDVENFTLSGTFEVNGLLNAGNIDIAMKYATSEVKEIGGEKINIYRKQSFFNFGFIHKGAGELTTKLIEGDDIYIEYTKANIVRGNNVEIGPGCEVGIVEYKVHFKHANDSIVKEHKKV